MSEPTPGAEAVTIPTQKGGRRYQPRHRSGDPAHQPAPPLRRAAGSVAASAPAAPATSAGPTNVERFYATPVWVQPSVPRKKAVPHQHAPGHDQIRPPVGRVAPAGRITRPVDLMSKGRWTTPRSGRTAFVLLFVASLAAATATGAGVMSTRSTSGLAVALACLLAASGVYAVLVALRPTVVELDEVWLTVRDQGYVDMFDLTNPFQEIAVSGKPGTAGWRLVLGCPDRRTVVVTGRMVDSRRLHEVVSYAQRYARRERSARLDRFSR